MAPDPGREGFARAINVSRETMDRLDEYAALLRKWNSAINLVGKSTLANLWSRHFLDSAQVFAVSACKSGLWVDIGTGGGFPGMVVAAMAAEQAPDISFTFIESDQRKSTFLRTVAQQLELPVTVLAQRIENVPGQGADVVSARALAPTKDLLNFADLHLKPGGIAVFLKGATYREELAEASTSWAFQCDEIQSMTDAEAVILKIGDIRRV